MNHTIRLFATLLERQIFSFFWQSVMMNFLGDVADVKKGVKLPAYVQVGVILLSV